MKTSRRDFFKSTLLATPFLAGAGRGLFAGEIRHAVRRIPASQRVTLAVIGCGTMGKGNMWAFLNDPRVRVVAVCDPVLSSMKYGYSGKEAGGRAAFKKIVDEKYGDTGCRMVADWREIIADPTVDAVQITTTDHWHALIAVAAMRAGKHVYCQKPMTLGVSEGILMTRVAKETGVTFQVGSQQRSASEFRVACELFRNGYLGECSSCTIGLTYPHNDSRANGHARDPSRTSAPDYFTPKGMWDLWQGPAEHWPENAFIPGIHEPLAWRWNFRTGGGTITDWGAHHLDILQWALGTDRSGPAAIENFSCDFQPNNSTVTAPEVFSTPFHFAFDVVYANGFRAHVCDTSQGARQGLTFHASKGDLFVTRGKLDRPKHLRKWNEKRDLKGSDVHLYKSRASHEMDFIDGVYSGGPVACPCEIGHRSITIAHLGNICAKLGRKGLKWDPVKEQVVGDADANALLNVKYANGWKI